MKGRPKPGPLVVDLVPGRPCHSFPAYKRNREGRGEEPKALVREEA